VPLACPDPRKNRVDDPLRHSYGERFRLRHEGLLNRIGQVNHCRNYDGGQRHFDTSAALPFTTALPYLELLWFNALQI
jgi:hypothetical protein